jgi:amino acid permease
MKKKSPPKDAPLFWVLVGINTFLLIKSTGEISLFFPVGTQGFLSKPLKLLGM